MPKKPYWEISIVETHEPLVPIPQDVFVLADPHPYAVLGAPYGGISPFFVRKRVLEALLEAQRALQTRQPRWKLFVFDAYRPVAVQKFMVEFTFAEQLQNRGLEPSSLSAVEVDALWEEVYQLWAPPNLDPQTPPPHSTGAALDLTLFDTQTQSTVEMGSPIDEFSPRSQPNHFDSLVQDLALEENDRTAAAIAHTHRQILYQSMREAGFQRHPGEWWHFSLGDQLWAWLCHQENPQQSYIASYGRVV